MKQTIVIMSGSFNPPTIAHHKTMLAAVNTLDANKGIYIPTPAKDLRYKMRKAGFPEEVLSEESRTAIEEGYTRLVLGAWGCGNFGNDPELVAKLFHQVLMESNPVTGISIVDYFEEIAIAVFDNSAEQRWYQPFAGYFPDR